MWINMCNYPKKQTGNKKYRKPQNENICLTNPNVETIGIFHILTFGVCAKWSNKGVTKM